MEKMHYNKQLNGKTDETILNCTATTITISSPSLSSTATAKAEREREGERTLLNESSPKKRRNSVNKDEVSEIGKYSATTTSCTSSTDSGVNISDNEEPALPSPSLLNAFNKQFHKSNKNNTKQITDKNSKNNSNNNNNQTFNDDVDDCDDDNNDNRSNSKYIESKLKSEQPRMRQQLPQQFIKVENISNGNYYTRSEYHPTRNGNDIESDNVINISHSNELNSKTTTTRATANNVTETLQHNEFINPPHRSMSSSSSSLSMSSTTSYEHHPPSKMQNTNSSPVVSIRSIDSSIIDSDSDSDLNGDTEGVHENYVIKKLGTQVTYAPRHPDIPNINKGHTVLNQQVTSNDVQVPPSPLDALAAIGDRIGAAQALGPVPSVSANAQRPQIGSIALSNSSDVTFGDKHFYEGPVTIQQFLIDGGRDKWKDNNGNENPTFANDTTENPNNAKDITPSTSQTGKLYGYISKHKKLLIPGVLAVMALLIVSIIVGSEALNGSKNTNSNNVDGDDECFGNGTLCLMERDVWRAHPQKNKMDMQKLPLHRAIISHTASEACDTPKICFERVRVIQEFHMNSLGWDDIGYNFLISSDGRVYVGRGWDAVGAHTLGYNRDSVGISFIGTYMTTPPTEAQLNACRALLEEGVRLKKLIANYHLYGARQFQATESPGDMLYKKIKKWEHWSADINPH